VHGVLTALKSPPAPSATWSERILIPSRRFAPVLPASRGLSGRGWRW